MRRVAITLLVILTFGCLSAVYVAHAEVSSNPFDETYVLNDLNGAEINGKIFDVADYPQSDGGEVRLLEFVEWEFSTKFEYRYSYGLYFYLYNPSVKSIAPSELNKVQMAVEYKEGKPIKYGKYGLKLLSESVDKLFYKFKVLDVSDIYARVVVDNERHYDISGIEVMYEGATNAAEFNVGGSWRYTGYAKGMAYESEEESTLVSRSDKLQTVVLDDLKFTYYRTWRNLVGTIADQLTSVYFSVDKSLTKDYDDLYSIQAECWQYLTSPIFCLYDKYIFGENAALVDYAELYSTLMKQRGVDQKRNGEWLAWDAISAGGGETYMTTYNIKPVPTENVMELKVLSWLFQMSKKEDFTIGHETLSRYMKEYSEQFGKDVQGKYSKDLFSDKYYSWWLGYPTVEKAGYMPIDISCDDTFTLVGSSRKASFWDYLTFGATFDKSESEPLCPIVAVEYADIKGMSDSDVSEKYLVAERDVAEFRQSVKAASSKGKVTYLFRFDTSTYVNEGFSYKNYGVVGYMAQEMAYLDFDIISLGYRKNGVVTMIPVVNSPIDIVPTVEPGQDVDDWLSGLGNKGYKVLPVLMAVVLMFAVVWLTVRLVKDSKG